MAKLDARLEVRVDSHLMGSLERRAVLERVSVAELVRRAIREYVAVDPVEERLATLDRAFRAGLDVPPDPRELKRQLVESRYEKTAPEHVAEPARLDEDH